MTAIQVAHRPQRAALAGVVQPLVAEGTTVLLTTQYMEEADQLAHRVAVMDHGRVIAQGTPDELKAKIGGQVLEVRPADPADLDRAATLLTELTGGRTTIDRDIRQLGVPISDTPGSRSPSGGWTRPTSPWSTWRCAAPAWTRCSWP